MTTYSSGMAPITELLYLDGTCKHGEFVQLALMSPPVIAVLPSFNQPSCLCERDTQSLSQETRSNYVASMTNVVLTMRTPTDNVTNLAQHEASTRQ